MQKLRVLVSVLKMPSGTPADLREESADLSGRSAHLCGTLADLSPRSADISGTPAHLCGESADLGGRSAQLRGRSAWVEYKECWLRQVLVASGVKS